MIIWREEKKNLLIHPFQSGFRCKHLQYHISTAYTFLADSDEQICGVWRDIPRPEKGLWPCGSQYHDVQVWMLSSKFKFSFFFLIVSWRQNAKCFPLWLIFFWRLCKVWGTTRLCLGPILFSIFINDLSLHVTNISVACDMLADNATLHTSGKKKKKLCG